MNFLSSVLIIKRLPRLGLVLFLILLSGFAEAFGISVLVPVVTSLLGESLNSDTLGFPFDLIPKFLVFFGLPINFGSILILVLFFMILSFLAVFIQERAVAISRYDLLENLRNKAMHELLHSKWKYLGKISTGELSNKLLVESDKSAEAVIAVVLMIAYIVQLTVYVILAFILSWNLSLVALCTLVLAAITSKRLISRVKDYGDKGVNANNAYNRQIVDVFKGSKLVRSFAIEEFILERLNKLNARATSIQAKILVNQSLMKFEIQALISSALVLILFIAVNVLNIEVTTLLIFLYIVLRVAPKFFSLQGQLYSYNANSPSLQIVDKLIYDSIHNKELLNNSFVNSPKLKSSIELRDVSFKYNNQDTLVLQNISVEIKKSEFIAIVGPSGSGKSTLLDILMGLITPTSGQVTIDGKCLTELDINAYKAQIGFVPQESMLFDGTIKDNLNLNQFHDQSRINEALKIAQVYDFISGLPKGLDTEVGEGGSNLSGGQRQRLSIARALIRNPKILILDEATSSLDSRSELLFQNAIEEISSNHTLIVVAHRLSTIKKAKKIIVIDQGKLVESGTYEDLIAKDGLFSSLNKSQIIKE